ncbi:unnamed protein product [Amaranthus hypochondriacus]
MCPFEFGSAGALTGKVTLAGYCRIFEELEPCRWEVLPSNESTAPQFQAVQLWPRHLQLQELFSQQPSAGTRIKTMTIKGTFRQN